jgi:hypothetical protein
MAGWTGGQSKQLQNDLTDSKLHGSGFLFNLHAPIYGSILVVNINNLGEVAEWVNRDRKQGFRSPVNASQG